MHAWRRMNGKQLKILAKELNPGKALQHRLQRVFQRLWLTDEIRYRLREALGYLSFRCHPRQIVATCKLALAATPSYC